MVPKKAEVEYRYNWAKKKASSDNWDLVPKNYTKKYNWMTNTPKLEDRWQWVPKEN